MTKAADLGRAANIVATSLAFKNRLVNPMMAVDQRQAGAAVTPSASGYTIDRYKLNMSQASKLTAQQNAGSVTPPPGFQNYLGITVASAFTPGATDYFDLVQYIEANNISDLNWGTANAQPVSLHFRVYSSLTGTFSGAIQNYAATRTYPFTFTITQANTWQTIYLPNIPGDQSGAWVLNGTGGGMALLFSLGAGANNLTTGGAWAAGGYIGTTGSVNLVATAGATFYVTGVMLEKGPVCSPFEVRPIGAELQLAQRYFRKFPIFKHWAYQSAGNAFGTTLVLGQSMRANPSWNAGSVSYLNASGLTAETANTDAVTLNAAASAAGYAYFQLNGASVDAEL